MNPEAWRNSVGNLRSSLRDLSSQDVADKLKVGFIDGWIGASELQDYFLDMYDILVPGELPQEIEDGLRALHALLEEVIPLRSNARDDLAVVESAGWETIQSLARVLDEKLRSLHPDYGQF